MELGHDSFSQCLSSAPALPSVCVCVCVFGYSCFCLHLFRWCSCFSILLMLMLSSSSIRFIRNRFSISLFVHLRLSHNYWLSFCDYVIKHTKLTFEFVLCWTLACFSSGAANVFSTWRIEITAPRPQPSARTHNKYTIQWTSLKRTHTHLQRVKMLSYTSSFYFSMGEKSFHFFDKELPDVAILFYSPSVVLNCGSSCNLKWLERRQRLRRRRRRRRRYSTLINFLFTLLPGRITPNLFN